MVLWQLVTVHDYYKCDDINHHKFYKCKFRRPTNTAPATLPQHHYILLGVAMVARLLDTGI